MDTVEKIVEDFASDLGMSAFSSGMRLRDMIRAIRASKTAAEERPVVRRECAAIRAAISENDQDLRHRNMAKLMFIHMLGYPTHFGQMECLKLIADAGFPEKRVGYLGLTLLLDERQEVLMLVTNSLKQDLSHSNQFIVGLALCALGNICSAEMARDLAPEVERLMRGRDVNTKKKAALCSIRIVRKVPDLAENFMALATSLLKEKHHGVLISAVQLCTELCKASKDALDYLRKNCIEGLVRILRDVSNSSYAPEYDVSGISDPFLHIRVLKLMRVLGHGDADCSEYMNDILAQVSVCPTCSGQGEVISEYCRKCSGEGRIRVRKEIKVKIPPGVSKGSTLRVRGEGDAGPRGGPPSDLYVCLDIEEPSDIKRDGINLYSTVSISYVQAILGTVQQVRTVDGTSELRIPPGTQPGDVIVLAKQGVPSLNKPSIRGDHLFPVKVTIPKRISGRERELLEELATLRGGGFARTAPKPNLTKPKPMHQEKEVGPSQENNDKPNEEEGDWLKKLSDFAGSIASGAAKWLKDNL